MLDQKPSSTADIVTAIRAFWCDHPENTVFKDTLAQHLLPRQLKKAFDSFLGRKAYNHFAGPVKPLHAEVLGRARYVEDQLDIAINKGACQYVIVGAGMDTFAHRRTALAKKLKVFELDHPATQALKKKRISEAGFKQADNLEYVEINFLKESVEEALERSSFDPKAPCIFCWMGVTYYLSNSVSLASIESMMKSAAPGSELIFDYMLPQSEVPLFSKTIFFLMNRVTSFKDEPVIGQFSPPILNASLKQLGLDIIADVSSNDLENLYFKRKPMGFKPVEGMHIMHCRKP